MKYVTIHEAKTQLSRLIREIEAGGEIVIRRGKEPVARLIAEKPVAKPKRKPGQWADLRLSAEENALLVAPMTEEELADWYGSDEDMKA
ncbi:type II toxin-antitoxin system Phd/YefM family antitoxin [Glycocaulis sp.]|uniref:type II toxin-antitoxin system Phd/YefM family antitoxin n=1 Tax=Glycocaulis sp. TaxID=1969725 RepID=UPI003D1E62A0